jgi:hypothetical protein
MNLIETKDFELAHGRKPRGTGHWAFFFDNDPQPWWVPEATFTAAKKAALAEAYRRGAMRVKVGS